MNNPLVWMAAICICFALAWRRSYVVGKSDGIAEGFEVGFAAGEKSGHRHYGQTIGKLNVALGSMTLGEIAEAMKYPTTDKVTALLQHLDKKAVKAELDARARVAEWTRPQ